ncbi:hypothetical protein TNCV_279641 [Trichonephila clavipes]|nr:hypothetical protein TNCV_279641 [Trichonephila clavipes]
MAFQVTRSFANRACLDALGRQLQPSRDAGELTAQMQRLWQDLPQGDNRNPGCSSVNEKALSRWHVHYVQRRILFVEEKRERFDFEESINHQNDHAQGLPKKLRRKGKDACRPTHQPTFALVCTVAAKTSERILFARKEGKSFSRSYLGTNNEAPERELNGNDWTFQKSSAPASGVMVNISGPFKVSFGPQVGYYKGL